MLLRRLLATGFAGLNQPLIERESLAMFIELNLDLGEVADSSRIRGLRLEISGERLFGDRPVTGIPGISGLGANQGLKVFSGRGAAGEHGIHTLRRDLLVSGTLADPELEVADQEFRVGTRRRRLGGRKGCSRSGPILRRHRSLKRHDRRALRFAQFLACRLLGLLTPPATPIRALVAFALHRSLFGLLASGAILGGGWNGHQRRSAQQQTGRERDLGNVHSVFSCLPVQDPAVPGNQTAGRASHTSQYWASSARGPTTARSAASASARRPARASAMPRRELIRLTSWPPF